MATVREELNQLFAGVLKEDTDVVLERVYGTLRAIQKGTTVLSPDEQTEVNACVADLRFLTGHLDKDASE